MQILLVRRWTLTGDLRAAPVGPPENPSAPTADPPSFSDYRQRLLAWAEEKKPGKEDKKRTLGVMHRRLNTLLPEGETLGRSTVYAILTGERHVALNHVHAWAKAMDLRAEEKAWLSVCVELAHTSSELRRAGAGRLADRG